MLSLFFFNVFTLMPSLCIPKRKAFVVFYDICALRSKQAVVNAPIIWSFVVRQTNKMLFLLSIFSWKLWLLCCLKLYSFYTDFTSFPTSFLMAEDRDKGNSCLLFTERMILGCEIIDSALIYSKLSYKFLFLWRKTSFYSLRIWLVLSLLLDIDALIYSIFWI